MLRFDEIGQVGTPAPCSLTSIDLVRRRTRGKRTISLAESTVAMKRLDLLKQMSFGVQVAEDEVNELASYFVETNQWEKIAKGDIDIIRGEKGSGKSAIYSLLMTKAGDFFDKRILLVAAENPRGATVFKDLVADPPTTENEFNCLMENLRTYNYRATIERIRHSRSERRASI
jgi:hypothetical protein